MKSQVSLKDRIKYIGKECERHVNRHNRQLFLSWPAGILLFFLSGLGGKLFAAVTRAPSGAKQDTVIVGSVPLSSYVIGTAGVLWIGALIGMILYLLGLFVYYWIKTYCVKK